MGSEISDDVRFNQTDRQTRRKNKIGFSSTFCKEHSKVTAACGHNILGTGLTPDDWLKLAKITHSLNHSFTKYNKKEKNETFNPTFIVAIRSPHTHTYLYKICLCIYISIYHFPTPLETFSMYLS